MTSTHRITLSHPSSPTQMPDTPVTNFTSDWHSGTSLGNLMQSLKPSVFSGLVAPTDPVELSRVCINTGVGWHLEEYDFVINMNRNRFDCKAGSDSNFIPSKHHHIPCNPIVITHRIPPPHRNSSIPHSAGQDAGACSDIGRGHH